MTTLLIFLSALATVLRFLLKLVWWGVKLAWWFVASYFRLLARFTVALASSFLR